MDILHDDVDLVADSLASLAYTIWNALRHPDGIQGEDVAGAAWILSGHLHDLVWRLKDQKAVGHNDSTEDDPDVGDDNPEQIDQAITINDSDLAAKAGEGSDSAEK